MEKTSSVLVIGGGGMIGKKLIDFLLSQGWTAPQITAFDMAFPPNMPPDVTCITGDVTQSVTGATLAAQQFDVIYHLASIVSGEAEANFDKGWHTNLFPLWSLLENLRAQHLASGGRYRPRFIFTSSIAVFGGPYPDEIPDDFRASPQTSYGAQKAACEIMIQDVSRKGFIDGVSLRLPTICVRPGKPNKAASGFFSGIIREPINGQDAILPVSEDVRAWFASPRTAAKFLWHAAQIDTAVLKGHLTLNLPGVSCTVAEQIDTLRDVVGTDAAARITKQPDAAIQAIVDNWPQRFAANTARAMGFEAETDFADIIKTYLEDDFEVHA